MAIEDLDGQCIDENQDDALDPHKSHLKVQPQADAEDGDPCQHYPEAGGDDMPRRQEVEDRPPSLDDVEDRDEQEVEEVAPEDIAEGQVRLADH